MAPSRGCAELARGEEDGVLLPLPSLQRLQSAARRWGIRSGDRVVAYDDSGGLAAARAWWLLRWGGLSDIRLALWPGSWSQWSADPERPVAVGADPEVSAAP